MESMVLENPSPSSLDGEHFVSQLIGTSQPAAIVSRLCPRGYLAREIFQIFQNRGGCMWSLGSR